VARSDIGYRAAHDRVQRTRGKAVEYPCRDCGGQATNWSYQKGSPSERVHVGGKEDGFLFSPDPNDYDPLCFSCHSKADNKRKDRLTCRRGHPATPDNQSIRGTRKQCLPCERYVRKRKRDNRG
jgi:hypothetical protein